MVVVAIRSLPGLRLTSEVNVYSVQGRLKSRRISIPNLSHGILVRTEYGSVHAIEAPGLVCCVCMPPRANVAHVQDNRNAASNALSR